MPKRDGPWRICVAPMMRYTDRHFRVLASELFPGARLYTEMAHAHAVVYRGFDHPDLGISGYGQAFQVGGSCPLMLAKAAKIIEAAGYAEVNLNVGCPSPTVQKGAFGACLMREPSRVADALSAMAEAVQIPVTIKTRMGVDRDLGADALHRLIEAVDPEAVKVWQVHARKAWLDGLDPKANRHVPPLQIDDVYALPQRFKGRVWVINGGIRTRAHVEEHLKHVDGVMIGRWLLEQPLVFRRVLTQNPPSFEGYLRYMDDQLGQGVKASAMTRHLLALAHGLPGAKAWRRAMGDAGSDLNAIAALLDQLSAFSPD